MSVAARRRALVVALAVVACGAPDPAGGRPPAVRPAATPAQAAPALRAAPAAVPILMYHRIASAPAGTAHPSLWVPAATLRRQLDALAGDGFHAVTLGRLWRAWRTGARLPAKPVVLSFDDGYASQFSAAAPLLRSRRWPAVLNLQVDRLDARGGLSAEQVRSLLASGWELDAHTVTHPDLTTVDPERLRAEVAGSRTALRERFGVPVAFFAYPYGRRDAAVEDAVRAAGFLGATTIQPGLASRQGDPLALRRILVSPRQGPAALLARLRRARPG